MDDDRRRGGRLHRRRRPARPAHPYAAKLPRSGALSSSRSCGPCCLLATSACSSLVSHIIAILETKRSDPSMLRFRSVGVATEDALMVAYHEAERRQVRRLRASLVGVGCTARPELPPSASGVE